MSEKKPYDGLARVTEIVAEICGSPEPGWLSMCTPTQQRVGEEWPTPTEDSILDWSSMMGTAMHETCLEGVESQNHYVKQAKAYFDQWTAKHSPQRIEVEQVCIHPDSLYGGTIDMLCRIGGKRYIVDLKFFGWWKEHFGYEQSKDPFPSMKSAKVNLQTNLYDLTQKRDHIRACLIIHPKGWLFHEFKRDSKHIPKALEIAKTVSRRSDKYLLHDF